jgi:hypothetical protein
VCVLFVVSCDFSFAPCSNEQPLAPQQLFLMSLICNVHPSSQFLDVLPPAPLQQQLLQPGGSLAPGQQQQQQQQQQQRDAAGGGDEEILQLPVRLGAGPVVAGSEAPGETCTIVLHSSIVRTWCAPRMQLQPDQL